MSGYTKIFSSLVDSTVWRESKETKIVWITMLAKSDRYGHVEASVPGLADAAKVSLKECLEALKVLSSDDPWSRTKEHGGKRIQEIDGGWLILNHTKYRDKMSAEDRLERQRKWQADYRKRMKSPDRQAAQGGRMQAINEGFDKLRGQPVVEHGRDNGGTSPGDSAVPESRVEREARAAAPDGPEHSSAPVSPPEESSIRFVKPV